MVANGLNSDWAGNSADMNVFNFSQPSHECSLPDYPIAMHNHVGGIVDGMVIICGGFDHVGIGELKDCYKFDLSTYSWMKLADLPVTAVNSAAAPLNGALWVTGLFICTNTCFTFSKLYVTK